MIDLLTHLFFCFILIEMVMGLFWLLYLAWKNVSVVDIGWGVSILAAGILYTLIGQGFYWRKLLLFILVFISAGRLVYHLTKRFDRSQKDPRYEKIFAHWPFKWSISLQVLTHYLFQGLIATLLTLPFLLIAYNESRTFTTLEIYGVLVVLGGVWGESLADQQLFKFKSDPSNKGKVCEQGLWRYSRHPNYFFQVLIWVGFSLFAFSANLGWLAVISPVIIFYLLVKVSGIPLAEEQSLLSKGEAYKEYQKRTSSFFPWFANSSSKDDEGKSS